MAPQTSETITGSFINPIGSIIISRFVLDLREVGLSMNSGSEEQATIGDMEFTTQFDLPISSSSLPL
ncbi:uncharacterized protein FIBRA_04629 [Fibroporia radiculosa]|uniref:Uncharacterized protein n=1 Tax=Fibroporia radiculosa TaxID=599839 RepID=J4HWM6_9APHY|nr:uncharacterized protein FIBRA_04629 [Fibroporia radiculosa]CCM02527.1 predicted protein [Fibroporia radiculosa]